MIVDEIKAKIQANTVIPKIRAKKDFTVKGWGKRRGENALIYRIPSHNPNKPYYEKGITESEWIDAYNQLMKTGYFTHQWFEENLPDCAKEGSCNFTTIGGIFELLKLAKHSSAGIYNKI